MDRLFLTRAALGLRARGGSYRAIAKELDIPVGYVHKLVQRAIDAIPKEKAEEVRRHVGSLRVPPMTPEESRRLWEEVKANFRRLDSCPGPHEFPPRGPKDLLSATRYTCSRCGGTVDGRQRLWYERGIAHGKLDEEALRARVQTLVDEGGARQQEIGRLRTELRLVKEGSIT